MKRLLNYLFPEETKDGVGIQYLYDGTPVYSRNPQKPIKTGKRIFRFWKRIKF